MLGWNLPPQFNFSIYCYYPHIRDSLILVSVKCELFASIWGDLHSLGVHYCYIFSLSIAYVLVGGCFVSSHKVSLYGWLNLIYCPISG